MVRLSAFGNILSPYSGYHTMREARKLESRADVGGEVYQLQVIRG